MGRKPARGRGRPGRDPLPRERREESGLNIYGFYTSLQTRLFPSPAVHGRGGKNCLPQGGSTPFSTALARTRSSAKALGKPGPTRLSRLGAIHYLPAQR